MPGRTGIIPGIAWTDNQTRSAVSLALQQVPDGSWIVDADRDLSGQITAENLTIEPMDAKPAFRYLLAKSGMTAKKAADWLASLVTVREKAPIPVRALPAQPALPSTVSVPLEAEDFAHQEHGKAEAIDGKPGAVGRSVRGVGNAAPDHEISWSFDVPRDGQYQLTVRYACNLPDVRAAFLIDGAAPP